MSIGELVWIAFIIAGTLAIGQSAVALAAVCAFRRYVLRCLAAPRPNYTPPALVMLPCRGVDSRLEQTIRGLLQQNYPEYRVCVAVDSADDPAKALADRMADAAPGRLTTVVSQKATRRAQKIENLLAALDHGGDWPVVYAFIDSDAVPHPDWLRHLVAPLEDDGVAASTGFRWYRPGRTVATLIRCAWNAVSLTWLGDHKRNFCWGGSMALRRETFETLDIRGRWDNALSEDYQVTRTVWRSDKALRFVPQCVIPCDGDATWWEFLTFARRQIIITRVCEPRLWLSAAVVSVNFTLGYITSAVMLLYGLTAGNTTATWAALGVIAAMLAINIPRAIVRNSTVRRLLPADAHRPAMWLWDVLTAPLLAAVNTVLMAASALTNRFNWRGTVYEMHGPDRTTVVSAPAQARSGDASADAGSAGTTD